MDGITLRRAPLLCTLLLWAFQGKSLYASTSNFVPLFYAFDSHAFGRRMVTFSWSCSSPESHVRLQPVPFTPQYRSSACPFRLNFSCCFSRTAGGRRALWSRLFKLRVALVCVRRVLHSVGCFCQQFPSLRGGLSRTFENVRPQVSYFLQDSSAAARRDTLNKLSKSLYFMD